MLSTDIFTNEMDLSEDRAFRIIDYSINRFGSKEDIKHWNSNKEIVRHGQTAPITVNIEDILNDVYSILNIERTGQTLEKEFEADLALETEEQ